MVNDLKLKVLVTISGIFLIFHYSLQCKDQQEGGKTFLSTPQPKLATAEV